MARAIRTVSVEQGADPRDAALVAFGGAGGLHATALARKLEMASVVVPPFAGVFSAFGLLLSPPRHDVALSVLLRGGDRLAGMVSKVTRRAGKQYKAQTGGEADSIACVLDMRYLGQAHETSVPYSIDMDWDDLTNRFHQAHQSMNGFARPQDPVEIVTVRAEAVGTPAMTWDALPAFSPSGPAENGHRQVMTSVGVEDASVWRREGLALGAEVVGPAIIEEGQATTYLNRGERAVVAETGALEVSW